MLQSPFVQPPATVIVPECGEFVPGGVGGPIAFGLLDRITLHVNIPPELYVCVTLAELVDVAVVPSPNVHETVTGPCTPHPVIVGVNVTAVPLTPVEGALTYPVGTGTLGLFGSVKQLVAACALGISHGRPSTRVTRKIEMIKKFLGTVRRTSVWYTLGEIRISH
jgi:hypothetical protein